MATAYGKLPSRLLSWLRQEAEYIRYWIDQAIWAKVAKLDHDRLEENRAARHNGHTGNGMPVAVSGGSETPTGAMVRGGKLYMGRGVRLQRLPESDN